MKVDHPHHRVAAAAWAACAFKWLFACVVVLYGSVAMAQTPAFQANEQLDYDLYFKWGVVFSKAGSATFTVSDTTFEGEPAWRYHLLFRSSGIVEKLYRMRDTICCIAANSLTREITIRWMSCASIMGRPTRSMWSLAATPAHG